MSRKKKHRPSPRPALASTKPEPYRGHLVDVVTGQIYRPATNGEWRAFKNATAEMERLGDHEYGVIIVDNVGVTVQQLPGHKG